MAQRYPRKYTGPLYRPQPIDEVSSAPKASRAHRYRQVNRHIVRTTSRFQANVPRSWQLQRQLPTSTNNKSSSNYKFKESRHPTIAWNLGDETPPGAPFKLDLKSKEAGARDIGMPPPKPGEIGWERWVHHIDGGKGTPEDPVIYWLQRQRDPERREACNAIARKIARDTKCGYIWFIKADHNLSYDYKNGEMVSNIPVKSDPHITVRYGTRFGHCNLHGHIYVKYDGDGYPMGIAERRFKVSDKDHRIVQLFHWCLQRKPQLDVPVSTQRQVRRQHRQQTIAEMRRKAPGSPFRHN
ncbi:hypothetical protein MGN70_005850 [Eutypa lata]|nr:hypothetical protein MGN70_005850 [Eutypa lata]